MNGRILFYCTGKGTHRRKDLAGLFVSQGQISLSMLAFGSGAAKTGPGSRWCRPVYVGLAKGYNKRTGTAGGNAKLKCVVTACTYAPAPSTETFKLLLADGRPEFDTSYLDECVRVLKALHEPDV